MAYAGQPSSSEICVSLTCQKWLFPIPLITFISIASEGSVLGLLQASFNGTVDGLPEAKELKEFLQESAAQGMTGGDILLDKEMLEVQEEKQMADEEDKWGPLRELQGWVLAMFGLLLLLCIIGALFFWYAKC
jgi:hypothetical protein